MVRTTKNLDQIVITNNLSTFRSKKLFIFIIKYNSWVFRQAGYVFGCLFDWSHDCGKKILASWNLVERFTWAKEKPITFWIWRMDIQMIFHLTLVCPLLVLLDCQKLLSFSTICQPKYCPHNSYQCKAWVCYLWPIKKSFSNNWIV